MEYYQYPLWKIPYLNYYYSIQYVLPYFLSLNNFPLSYSSQAFLFLLSSLQLVVTPQHFLHLILLLHFALNIYLNLAPNFTPNL
nr:MAG TPA: hypothetical protein [Caudoviricetes sp.]